MKKNLLSLLVVFVFTTLASNVSAQTISTVSATAAGAKLLKPMTLTQTSPLHFGIISLITTAGGNITLNTDGTRSNPAPAALGLLTAAPVATNAKYDVLGTKSTIYIVTVPTTAIVITGDDGGTMNVSDFTVRFNTVGTDSATRINTLSATGTDDFTVGAKLEIKLNQIAGIYTGTFPVSVDYN